MSTELSKTIQAGPSHPKRKWIVIALVVAVLAGAGIFLKSRDPNGNGGPSFVTESLRRGDLAITITATGNLEPTNEVTVGSELSGTVLEVLVDINDRVTKGQKLAILDTTKLEQTTERSRAVLGSAKAQVGQAEATLREAKASLARLQELHRLSGGKTPSKSEIDTATATADRAEADLASAVCSVTENEAAVRANESDLTKSIITSPVDGIVLTRNIEPGQTVAAQFTAPELFVIAESLDTMELEVAVAEADIGKVADGQTATFTVDAWPDRSFTAEVKRVSFGSTITDNLVTYATELTVDNKDLSLRPGMTATVDITTAGRDQVMLVTTAALRFKPQPPEGGAPGGNASGPAKKSFISSLLPGPPGRPTGKKPTSTTEEEPTRPGEATLWILEDGRPHPVPVKTGLSDGRHTEVSGEGLTEGASIIIRESVSSSKS